MTAAEVVGLSPDGSQLVLRVSEQTLEVPMEQVRRAERLAARHLSRAVDPGEPVTPRSIQQRIRCGESSEDIAAASGIPVADVARYEGPPLAERQHQASLARATVVEDRTVAELVAAHLGDVEVAWDSWLVEDQRWEVVATGAGQTLHFRWEALNRRVLGLDEPARRALRVPAAEDDVLTAVLRPVGTPQAAEPAPTRPRTGRAQVPLWEDISRQVGRRDESP